MKLAISNSIGIRFLRVVFGCYLLFTILITCIQLFHEYRQIENGIIEELANTARSSDKGLSRALWNIDTASIDFILEGILQISAIDGAHVVDLQNVPRGGRGIEFGDISQYSQTELASTEQTRANKIRIEGENGGTFYKYIAAIVYREMTDTPPELIGFLSLYANRNLAIDRFKSTVFKVVSIAAVKTLALWLIFLYFSQRIIARPLKQLTRITKAISQSEKQGQVLANMTQLDLIAQSREQDELQDLAIAFTQMQKSLTEKLNNLYNLNDFAMRISTAPSSQHAFQLSSNLLQNTFGSQFAIVYDYGKGRVAWSSVPESEIDGFRIQHFANSKTQKDPKIFNRNIAYFEKGGSIRLKGVTSTEGIRTMPVITLPLICSEFEHAIMMFVGPIEDVRLTTDRKLSLESMSFLQVVASMVGNSLTDLQQRVVIKSQKQDLERRVEERTKELEQVNAELKHIAAHDPLTKLPNRTLFTDRLEQLLHAAQRKPTKFAIASIDLTKFKLINDNYGHDVGDKVLIEVSRRFSESLRRSDTLARMGGDEFAAIFRDSDSEASLETIMDQLMKTLNAPIQINKDFQLVAGANVGIALYPKHAQSAEQLFKLADIAMYHAKRENIGYTIFDAHKTSAEKEITKMIHELELAIIREELVLHFQPIVDIHTLQVAGFEALIRWIHPKKGLIPPDLFIPHAETSRHIMPLTLWVFKAACKQHIRLKRAGFNIPISVNISPRVFSSPELPMELQNILDIYGMHPDRIKLEITEGTAMTNPDDALTILERFKNMGSPISIDDFGTGHSSLAYLTRLPLDELKIDKSFLTSDSANNRMIVETIIELAHALELKVVAEGIESEETRQQLIDKGCDYAQGYFISRPMIEAALIPFLKSHSHPTELKQHKA